MLARHCPTVFPFATLTLDHLSFRKRFTHRFYSRPISKVPSFCNSSRRGAELKVLLKSGLLTSTNFPPCRLEFTPLKKLGRFERHDLHFKEPYLALFNRLGFIKWLYVCFTVSLSNCLHITNVTIIGGQISALGRHRSGRMVVIVANSWSTCAIPCFILAWNEVSVFRLKHSLVTQESLCVHHHH